MKIAVEGCAHGDLDTIYATIQHLEAAERTKIDLLICCGDFQAVRNPADLEALACPPKFRAMNSFWKYYAGVEQAPYPTLFIGGNHEASNHLWELFYGGWAAPNIYFLGFAGVVKFGGLRIGGLSGIFKPHDYNTGHHERPPYNNGDMRSVYHIREYDVRKLLELQEPLDVMLSHDWPRGVTAYGNQEELLRRKPFFRDEVEKNILGSTPGMKVLKALQPSYWFSAHLHVKFPAVVPHGNGQVTKFLALDKCLPRRPFLQVVEFPEINGPPEFAYDEEWLAITRAYHSCLPLTRAPPRYPGSLDMESHRDWVRRRLAERGSVIPHNFAMTVAPHDPQQPRGQRSSSRGGGNVRSPQTEAFLELLEVPYTLDRRSVDQWKHGGGGGGPTAFVEPAAAGGEEGDEGGVDNAGAVPDDVDEFEEAVKQTGVDPNEISLDWDDEDAEEEEG